MTTARLPLMLRAFNRAVGGLRGAGLPVLKLDLEALERAAVRRARLESFGEDSFRDGLRRLVDSLESEARLTPFGRRIARGDLVRLLENRLQMEHAHSENPEIVRVPVRAPIFIMGLPRTGTTILQQLLAQDPANRVPMTWEVMHPWPPPETATYASDPRIARVEKHLAGIDRVMPGFKRMHPMGALLPQECVALTAHDFASMIFHTTYRLPSYQAWLETADLRPVYRSHRRQLQYLAWRCPAERWVLKSPGHLWALDALLDVYPDACIVQTHRDPLKVVASLTSLVSMLRSIASDRIDSLEIGRDWTARLADGLQRVIEVRSRHPGLDGRIFDVRFSDFLGNEIQIVRDLYGHFGLELSGETETRMRRFLGANPSYKHGAHRYVLADAGLHEVEERRRYSAYQERFEVPSEPVH